MQTAKRQHKTASTQAAAAVGRRAGLRPDAAQPAVLSFKRTPSLNLQPKLSIGQPGDRYEQEADRVAEKVASQPQPRTPVLQPPPANKPQPRRPPQITPVIQQQSDDTVREEIPLQEEEQVAQGKAVRLQQKAAAESEDRAASLQPRPVSSGVHPAHTLAAPLRLMRRAMRPAGRAPPVQSRTRGAVTARAPPLQLKRTAVQTDSTRPPASDLRQYRADEKDDSNLAPLEETGQLRPKLIQCRAPPVTARSEASESRLDRELRQSRGGGLPLPAKTRIQMEEAIGADFTDVRVHTDARADEMNRMLGSQAFATGNAIYFGAGYYDPETIEGRRLLAHELTHTVQQNASPRQTPNPAVSPRAPPIQQSTPDLQGGFVGDRLNEYARHVPGWELFTVIIGYNPLTEQDVARTPQNLLRGFMGLVPGGTALYDKLNENGLIDEAFSWLQTQLSELDLSWSRLRNAIDAAWEEMDFIRWDPFAYNLRVLKRHLLPIWNDVQTFAGRVIDKMVELVRTTLLTPLVNFIRERTRAYPLLTVILGEDPVTGEPVARSLYNIVSAFLMLTESGEEYLNKLNESGKLRELSDWLDAEIEKLNVNAETVTNAFSQAWELLDLNAVLHPIDTFRRLYNIFAGPVTRLFNFVVAVARKVLALIKDWLLGLLKEYAHRIPGYPLLTVILGRDPLTGEAVPRTAENFIRGFLSFVPGGMEKFNNLKQSGAIDKAFAWLEEAVKKLGLIGSAFANAFRRMWQSFSINDLINPIGAFERVVAIFTEPVRMLIEFAVEVGLKVLEFIFEGVLGPTGARVLEILKRARSTFIEIIKKPVEFVGHLIDAVMQGFRQFSGNILDHLRTGLIGWLTGTLSSAGIQLPERFDLKGVISLVLQILGLTWPRIREKLVRHLGERAVSLLETAFEVVRLLVTEGPGALWERLVEYIGNLKDTIMESIRNWIVEKIVTLAVTKLASLLTPAGAVIQAIISIYNTIMFFIERINQILDLVESVVNSISRIASGMIQEAADFVEQSMARTIPVIISFLARLIGLGGIAQKIQDVIRKVQATVDRGVDRVVTWIVSQGRRLLNRMRGRDDPAAQQAVDPAAMTPDQKKAAAKQELEQWIRGGDRQGTAIAAKLPELKQKYRLSDIRLEMTDRGPRIGYYASAGAFTYFFEEEAFQNVESTTSAGFKTVNSASGVPTPKGVIGQKYAGQIAGSAFRCTTNTLDRPTRVVAEQTGIGSSHGRGGSSVQSDAGRVGMDEEQIMAGHRNTSYQGGHLIAYTILQENSNQGFNLAPQVSRFNAPAYFNIFEKVAMDTPTTVEISVEVGYAMHSYQVDQQTLVDHRILTHIDLAKDWTVSLAKRIPNTWNATIEAKQGTLAEGGVSADTSTARHRRVVTTTAAFNALKVDGDGPTRSERNWNSFKMMITEGGQVDPATGAATTGGSGRTRLSISATQLDFPAPSVQSRPANPAPAAGQTKLEVGSRQDRFEQEADAVADRVVQNKSGGYPIITPYCGNGLQPRPDSESSGGNPADVEGRLQAGTGPGRPLPAPVRSSMEAGIGADLSRVRIHTDASAVQMSRQMGARAFTHGNHIYFNQARYAPETSGGKHLLAHELTHVVQQDSRIRRKPVEPAAATPPAEAEKEGKGPLVLGAAPMPGLEPPVEGEIRSPAEVEQEAEAEAGIKKEKKAAGPAAKAEAKARPKPELRRQKKAVAEKKPAAKQPPAPAPKPLKGGNSDGMLNDFMTASATRMAATYPTLGAGVSETFKAEKQREAQSAPKLAARAGRGAAAPRPPPAGEEIKTRPAQIEEAAPGPAAPQKLAGHKSLAQPVQNERNNKALDQSPAGSWISWFKDRVLSFMSGIRTKDKGVNTSAGKPPKAKLTGEADPKRADRQRQDGDKQTTNAKDKVAAKIKANPGKQRIQPAPVEQTNAVTIEALPAQVETGQQDDMADYVNMPLPDNVRKKADQDMAPLLEKSLAKPKEDVKKAAVKRAADKQTQVSKAKAEVDKLNRQADQDQKNIVAASRSDVAAEQKKGLDEADQQVKKYRREADKEQTSLKSKVKKRVKEDEAKAAAKLKKAEQDAEKEKKKKEAEAAAKKRELKRKQKKQSWWDRVKSAIKSAIKAITKVIDGIFKALRAAVKFIIETAKKAALAVIELGRKFVVGLLNTFRKFLKSLVSNLIGKIFPELAKKINKAIDKVVDKAIAGVNKVAAALKKGVEALANALGKVLDKILSVFQTALKAAVQIAGAVLTGDFAEAAKIAFYAACDILGINPQAVINFMEKAGESLGKIFKSPSTFFNNVAQGVKKGIDQFVANIKQHLLNGLIAWLTGAMGDIQISLPEKFDLKGIFSLITQILGLTYANIRAKVVKRLGPKGEQIVSTLEKTFALVRDLVTKGPIALWERVKQSLSNLKERVMEGIRNAVIEKVIKAGVVWLISMLNPASALVKAIKMLYDLVMFFVERWDQIVAFAQSIWNSVNALANGRIGAAANAVEQALARSVPVILGLLASLLGLGGIGKSVQKVIRKLRQPIDAALDKVIDFIVRQGKKLLDKITGKAGAEKPREKQTPVQREKNKKACEQEIRAILTRGTTFGRFKAMLPKLKQKYQVREIRMDADFDIRVINSDPAEIKVAVAHAIGLEEAGKLAEAKPVSTGKRGEPEYNRPKPKEEFTFGTINASADHPPTLKAVLEKELKKHRLSLEEIEYNSYFSGFPATAARPSRVSGTIYGYIAGKVGAKARTGTSAVVGKMGNREASFREGSFRGGEGGYDGGHLIGHSFGGPDAYYNLVPMKARVNRQVYGGIEKFMRNQVRVDPSALPLDKQKSNLDITVAMNYGSGSYAVNMGQFLKVATAGLKTEKSKLQQQKEETLAKKLKLEEIKKGLPADPQKAAAELKSYNRQREAKKSELKKLRLTEERDLLVWNLAHGSGLLGASALLKDRKQARAQVNQAENILDPLAKLIAGLKASAPDTVLIGSLELRQRAITRLITEYGQAYADDPLNMGDRRLSLQGRLLRAHIRGLQKPRDLTRGLEKELARMPTIPESEKEIDAKIREYDEKLAHAIRELARTDQAVKLKNLEDKGFSGAGSAPVHSRIPTSFTVDLEYEAVAGKGGAPMVKADAKGTRKAFSEAEFKPPPGASKAAYGTITVSTAKPDTKLVLEEKAPKRDTSKPAGTREEEKAAQAAAAAKVKTTQRFRSSFTITQA